MIRADGTLATLPRLGLLIVLGVGLLLASVDPFTVLFYGSYVAVGVLLVIRRPRNAVGWLVMAIAAGFLGTTSRPNVDVDALMNGHGSLVDSLEAWIGSWIAGVLFVGYAALAFVFPSGRLPAGRWRRPAIGVLSVAAIVVLLSSLQPTLSLSPNGGAEVQIPNPIVRLPDVAIWPIVSAGVYVVTLAALAVGVINTLSRYRRADDLAKLQLRWLLAAMALVLVGIVVGLSIVAIHGDDLGGLAWIPVIFAYPAVPAAIGIAVLRYRLYEIDRIVNRALVYGVLTALLAGVFAGATALSQRLFIAIAGQSSDASVALTALIVVSVYAPLRKRVEAVVDRYFKYDVREYGPYLDELRRLLDLIEPERAAARLAREALRHTGATGVAVVGADGGLLATAGTWPAEPIETVHVPAAGARRPIASVLVGPRPDGRPHPASRLRALADAAAVAGAAMRVEP